MPDVSRRYFRSVAVYLAHVLRLLEQLERVEDHLPDAPRQWDPHDRPRDDELDAHHRVLCAGIRWALRLPGRAHETPRAAAAAGRGTAPPPARNSVVVPG